MMTWNHVKDYKKETYDFNSDVTYLLIKLP